MYKRQAPEAFRARQGDSIRGDVWALGATVYLLLTDRLPHSEVGDDGGDDTARFERQLMPPSRINLDVDEMLDQIVLRALSQDPQQRQADARELLTDLERWRAMRSGAPAALKSVGAPDDTKSALGSLRDEDDERGAAMVGEALRLARDSCRLGEAADIMEQAMNLCPDLRERHEYTVRLWRRGIAM